MEVGLEYPRVTGYFAYLPKASHYRVETTEEIVVVKSFKLNFPTHIISYASFIALLADSRASWTISSAA